MFDLFGIKSKKKIQILYDIIRTDNEIIQTQKDYIFLLENNNNRLQQTVIYYERICGIKDGIDKLNFPNSEVQDEL